MHALVGFLKLAVTRLPNAGVMGCYCVRDGAIYARNQALQAGMVMDEGPAFNVPAEDLEMALARMQEVESIAYNGSSITVRGGRLKSTIQCVQDEPPALPDMGSNIWSPCPISLTAAMLRARPFAAEQGIFASVRLSGARVTCINNRSGIDITVDGLDASAILVNTDVVEFLGAQDTAPDEYTISKGAICFRWVDGRWVRAQLLAGAWPEIVETVFNKAGKAAPVEITPEWREAYEDAAALADGTVQITTKALLGMRGAANVEVAIDTDVAPSHKSYWPTDQLNNVVACATHWNPVAYPEPALFLGSNLRGLVIGVRR